MKTKKDFEPKKELTAVCGLFCPSCGVFIGTAEDPKRLEAIAKRYNTSVEDWICHGCRSDKRSHFCEHECKMFTCAQEKGLDFCGECDEYPCDELKRFKAERPHRIELWEAQERIREKGYVQWFEEMLEHYACPKCSTINSAYDLKCRKCGEEPSCEYVRRNREEILSQLK